MRESLSRSLDRLMGKGAQGKHRKAGGFLWMRNSKGEIQDWGQRY